MDFKLIKKILISILPGLTVAIFVFSANTYFDLDLGKVIIQEITRIIGQLETTATTTLATTGGNVGIGTTTPASLLTVGSTGAFQVDSSGDIIRIKGITYSWPSSQAGGSGYVLTNDGSGNLSWQQPSAGVSGSGATGQVTFWTGTSTISGDNNLYWDNTNKRLGIGTTAPSVKLHVYESATDKSGALINIAATSSSYYSLDVQSGGTSRLYVRADGNVGIGTTAPGAKLEVAGRIYQSGLGYSTFFGYEAGLNDDLTYNANAFIGYQSGKANTTGYHNTALGYRSFYNNTTGTGNVAIGYSALYRHTSGQGNTAVGAAALGENINGSFNTAIGRYALRYPESYNNVAIGYGAGM